jgi:hypothetical protein
MKKIKVVFAVVGLLFGFFVLGSSLILASQKDISNDFTTTQRKIYLGKILPDHAFYPALMLVDKTLLLTSSGDEKIELMTNLAKNRMKNSQDLIQKGEEGLGLTTMTKSQKYLLLATHEVIKANDNGHQISSKVVNDLIVTFAENTEKIDAYKKNTDNETAVLDNLLNESKIMVSDLKKIGLTK